MYNKLIYNILRLFSTLRWKVPPFYSFPFGEGWDGDSDLGRTTKSSAHQKTRVAESYQKILARDMDLRIPKILSFARSDTRY